MALMTVMANATLADWLGSFAGICTTLAFLPQVIRTWRTGSARDLSLGWLVIFTTGVILWLAYGLMTKALPLILANLATLVLVGILILLKLRQRN
jgi:MtN3 and saliva related transmembrane protein